MSENYTEDALNVMENFRDINDSFRFEADGKIEPRFLINLLSYKCERPID